MRVMNVKACKKNIFLSFSFPFSYTSLKMTKRIEVKVKVHCCLYWHKFRWDMEYNKLKQVP